MVTEIVTTVMLDNSNRRVAATMEEAKPKKTVPKKKAAPKKTDTAPANPDEIIGQPCPLCGKGQVIKGKTAYGCSEWRNGCGWRKAF